SRHGDRGASRPSRTCRDEATSYLDREHSPGAAPGSGLDRQGFSARLLTFGRRVLWGSAQSDLDPAFMTNATTAPDAIARGPVTVCRTPQTAGYPAFNIAMRSMLGP